MKDVLQCDDYDCDAFSKLKKKKLFFVPLRVGFYFTNYSLDFNEEISFWNIRCKL